jgi:hypothetical protein
MKWIETVIKLAAALVTLAGALSTLERNANAVLIIHRITFIALVFYVVADLLYYTALYPDFKKPNSAAKRARKARWIVDPAVMGVGLYYWLSFSNLRPVARPIFRVDWVLATVLIFVYLVIDVGFSFYYDHFDKWVTAAVATLIALFYFWILFWIPSAVPPVGGSVPAIN